MTTQQKLIALWTSLGGSTAVIVALIATLLHQDCPPGGVGPSAYWVDDTKFEIKNIPTGSTYFAQVRGISCNGVMTGPSDSVYVYQTVGRMLFWSEKDSLLWWWPFTENTGLSTMDIVRHRVAALDGATWQSGLPLPLPIVFDGIDDKINVGALEPGGPPLRLEAKIKVAPGLVPAVSGGARIIDKSNASINYWQLTLYQGVAQPDSFQIRMRMRTSAGLGTLVTSKYCVKVGEWYTVVGTYDGVKMRVYVDNVAQGSIAWTGSVIAAPTVPVYIGWGGHGGQPFKGWINDVRVGRRLRAQGGQAK